MKSKFLQTSGYYVYSPEYFTRGIYWPKSYHTMLSPSQISKSCLIAKLNPQKKHIKVQFHDDYKNKL